MAKYGDVTQCLRALGKATGLVLTDEISVYWENGHVWSYCEDHPDFIWGGSGLTIEDQILPESVCIQAVGMPVAKVYPHRLLTGDIVVRKIVNKSNDVCTFLHIDIDAPALHFDSRSGSVW